MLQLLLFMITFVSGTKLGYSARFFFANKNNWEHEISKLFFQNQSRNTNRMIYFITQTTIKDYLVGMMNLMQSINLFVNFTGFAKVPFNKLINFLTTIGLLLKATFF